MLNTAETLATAIEQLSLLSAERTASLDDLIALNIARECIDELFRDCVDELSGDPQTAALWSALASASKLSSKPASGTPATDFRAETRVRSFWREFAPVFAWDFLPLEFLHELYVQWLRTEFPGDTAFSRETFTRRLKAVVTASGEWFHTRSRPGSLMNTPEPLLARVPNWAHDGSDRAVYGFRRTGS